MGRFVRQGDYCYDTVQGIKTLGPCPEQNTPSATLMSSKAQAKRHAPNLTENMHSNATGERHMPDFHVMGTRHAPNFTESVSGADGNTTQMTKPKMAMLKPILGAGVGAGLAAAVSHYAFKASMPWTIGSAVVVGALGYWVGTKI